MPNTKPNMAFTGDICQSCQFHFFKKSKKINWKHRNLEFIKLVKKIKSKKNSAFDALVPVSGGKDSITQVHYLIKSKLRVLALHVDNGFKTPIGEKNLNLIPQMGASLLILKPNLKIHKKLMKIGFLNYGDPDLMSHCLLHAFPIRTAIKFNIPLVLLGENSALEYSGDNSIDAKKMSFEWFNKYAANKGITAKIISKKYNIPFSKLQIYELPSKNELKKTEAVFCNYFFKWSGEKNLKIAKKYGFNVLKKNLEGTYRNYVSIDEKINRIHQYLKFLKFGYGRATDHACEDIRNNKITRKQAVKLVKKYDRVKLTSYFYKEFIDSLSIKRKDFYQILLKYKNKEIHKKITQLR